MTKYLIAQPWYDNDRFIFEPYSSQISGWQVIGWRINDAFHYQTENHIYVGLTSNTARNPDYNPAVDDYLTQQIQYTYGKGQQVWANTDKVTMGAMFAVVGNGGDAIGYANIYAKWLDSGTGKTWWFQQNYFDERGAVNRDSIYVDHFTGQAALAADLGHSKYATADSTPLQATTWQELAYKGLTQTQSQFEQLLADMQAKGFDVSGNANDHLLVAAGHAPELAFADSPSWLMEHSESFFFRLEG